MNQEIQVSHETYMRMALSLAEEAELLAELDVPYLAAHALEA